MQELLRRLELVKIAIDLNDEEIITQQLAKLKALGTQDDTVGDIVIMLENIDYVSAILSIDEYLSLHKGLIKYEDPQLQALRLELKALEKRLQYLDEVKREYIEVIDEFNTQYNLRLGSLIQEILSLKEKLLRRILKKKRRAFEAEKNKYEHIKKEYDELKRKKRRIEDELEDLDEFDDAYDELYERYQKAKKDFESKEEEFHRQRKKAKKAKKKFDQEAENEEYEEARHNFEEFQSEYEDVREREQNRFELSEEEKIELKKLYREAGKLCHPDIVPEEVRAKATEIMQRLNEAYTKHDLESIRKILESLENGAFLKPASDIINDIAILRARIEEIRKKIEALEADIATIEENETFKTIQEIDDRDAYFKNIEEQLRQEYRRIKDQILEETTRET